MIRNFIALFSVLSVFSLVIAPVAHADAKSTIWSVSYYQSMPNKKGISTSYCSSRLPGTFIGAVNKQLQYGVITNRNIKLDKFSFDSKLSDGIYFLTGNFRARGQFKNIPWEDHVHYYAYKLSEYGLTKGVWSSGDCKGYFIGQVVSRQVG